MMKPQAETAGRDEATGRKRRRINDEAKAETAGRRINDEATGSTAGRRAVGKRPRGRGAKKKEAKHIPRVGRNRVYTYIYTSCIW